MKYFGKKNHKQIHCISSAITQFQVVTTHSTHNPCLQIPESPHAEAEEKRHKATICKISHHYFILIWVFCLGNRSLAGTYPTQQLHCFFTSTNTPELSQNPVCAGKHPRFYYYVLLVHSEKCALQGKKNPEKLNNCVQMLKTYKLYQLGSTLDIVSITYLLFEFLIWWLRMLSLKNILELRIQIPLTFDHHLSPLKSNLSSLFNACYFIVISDLKRISAVVSLSSNFRKP